MIKFGSATAGFVNAGFAAIFDGSGGNGLATGLTVCATGIGAITGAGGGVTVGWGTTGFAAICGRGGATTT